MPEVTVEELVGTSAEAAYGLVSDVTRMGQWSPETTKCRWLDGAGPTVGARFRGANRKEWRRWTTTCTVVAADPGELFSFDVKVGPLLISRWTYEFISEGSGCRIRETWIDRRPGWMPVVDRTVMGISDRPQHNRETMQATLTQLGRFVETGTAGA
jgi:ribosome-associated toxin RatA of RatAB toxin-antitoxin module